MAIIFIFSQPASYWQALQFRLTGSTWHHDLLREHNSTESPIERTQ